MKLTVIGSGDAFGSGGRLQSAYLLDCRDATFLIDCGATTLIGMERLGLSFDRVSHVFVTHLHGDHYSGLVWALMHAAFVAHRTAPLTIYGPPGIEERLHAAMDILYPLTRHKLDKLNVSFHEMQAGKAIEVAGARVMAFEVNHPSGAPSHALRIEAGGKVFAYTGDSEWTDSIVAAGLHADLYLMECYKFEGTPMFHLSWHMIQKHIYRVEPKRIVLTHMAHDMLARRKDVTDARVTFAEDGATFTI